jgi:hypothetical protein
MPNPDALYLFSIACFFRLTPSRPLTKKEQQTLGILRIRLLLEEKIEDLKPHEI